jgi:putative ABC transport system permease protein
MWRALLSLSLAEWRHHPWRHGVALLAVALGVALASSVQLINASALAEFSQALRSVNGQPDAVLAAAGRDGFDDALYARLAQDEAVALVSPVLEIDSQARRVTNNPAGNPTTIPATTPPDSPATDPASNPASKPPDSPRSALRIVGIDALKVAAVTPGLMPRPAALASRDAGRASGTAPAAADKPTESASPERLSFFDPDAVFLNPTALAALGVGPGDVLQLQSASGWQRMRVAGTVAAGGAPLAVIDIAAAQARFDRTGRLSRLDLRLQPGTDAAAWQARFVQAGALPAGVRWAAADDAVQRVSNLSRAYRVNLGVLALVALLVGGFLVYSVVSLSVAQRTPSLALLGVLGLAARDRRRLVLTESAVVGAIGSLLGLAAGAGLAALALRLLGGDLGGGYFAGGAPTLAWPVGALAACGALGLAAALVGAWWPARQAERLSPALALKGLGGNPGGRAPVWPGLALLAGGVALALLPPVGGLPLAAYAAVAALLAGGVVLVPAGVQALIPLLDRALAGARHPVTLLALRRARFARQTAGAMVSGVVASLALSVAITVMVASFRGAVIDWLDSALPADLYARSSPNAAAADQAFLPPGFVESVARLPGVARVSAARQVPLQLRPQQPAVMLLTRTLGADPAATLPMLGAVRPARPPVPGQADELGVFVSEPAAAIYGWQVGDVIRLPLAGVADARGAGRAGAADALAADALAADALAAEARAAGAGAAAPPGNAPADAPGVSARVRGVWRDYARQFGAIAIDAADYQRLTGDARVNDLALWLQPGAAPAEVEAALRRAAGPDLPLELASTASLRALSLRIFDRSFAVTFYLQAVAIGVGLVGVAASLSAQVLARRKEFGLLAHLGLTRRQVIALVGAEAAAWLLAGSLIGLALGVAMAVVLVHVVNPQSFHWTMPLLLPTERLAALAGAVLAAGIATALWSARRAAGRSAVLAVKEDW